MLVWPATHQGPRLPARMTETRQNSPDIAAIWLIIAGPDRGGELRQDDLGGRGEGLTEEPCSKGWS